MASADESTNQRAIEIDVLVMLRKRWTHIVFGVVVGISLAALYHFSATPVYESNIEILVGQRSSEVTNSGTITGANASGDAIHEDQLATHMRLFVGRKMLADAIETGGLQTLASFKQASAEGKSLVDHILDNIEVERGGEGNASEAMVLRASFRDTNPDDAAVVLGAIYESYRTYVESHGQNSTEEAVKLIEEAREKHEAELVAADQEYRNFIHSVPVLIEGENVKDIHKERLANLEPELNLVRTSLTEATSRLEVIDTYLKEHAATIGDVDHLALLSQKEVERLKLFLEMTRGEASSEAFQAEQPIRQEVAKAQYNRLLDLVQKEKSFSDAFGPGHPLVEAVRQEAEITRQFIQANSPDRAAKPSRKLDPAEMLKTYTMLLRNDIAEFEKRKTLLLEESARELKLAKAVERDFMMGNALRSKLSRAQARYDQVILRLQELKLSRSYAGFSTDVLANPESSEKAAWPNLPIVGLIGTCFGFGLGLMLALGAELVDSTFNNVQDLEHAVGAPAIAHVPRFDRRELVDAMELESNLDGSLVAFHSPRSAESEVYRVARTSLMIANRKGSMQTVMMTSPQPGDGKSTTISNLAISLARAGKRVLLIDADMRRPVISKLFGLEDHGGLSDVLFGEISLAQGTVTTEVEGLHVMPNGLPTSVPAELLESHRLPALLKQAKQHYDMVLIDAPPLLAVADPAIIAPMVDSVVLTVRVNKNGRRPVEHAARILADIDVQPTAVIVNAVETDKKRGYGYGSYSQGQYAYVGHYHDRYSARDGQPRDLEIDRKRRSMPAPHHSRDRRPLQENTPLIPPTSGHDTIDPSSPMIH